MRKRILKLIEKNARMDIEDIATVTGASVSEVENEIALMQKEGIIRGYKGVIDWEKVDSSMVSAIIELKVTPKAGLGFEDVAARISKFPEVESVYLMSGVCDLIVIVKGRTFHEVSQFVAKELAIIDSVTSTATQFVMRRYKEFGVELVNLDVDERAILSL
jgi:DNA-binding Lrp family transcriptional regulator